MEINGREIASEILNELKEKVQKLKEKGIIPHLAIILIGDNPQSKSYVEQKELKGNKVGIKTSIYKLSDSISTKELVVRLNDLNHLSNVHGIIVQRPLPLHIKNETVNISIDPKKDVDAFNLSSPYNPPIAEAVLKLLEHIFSSKRVDYSNFNDWLNSQSIVILGKGETGGGPIIRTFEKMGVNYSLVDSRTPNPELITKNANIIISAVGKSNTVKAEMLKKGVTLISVGLSKGSDKKLHGDYDENEIQGTASFYTPTPGGVGPVNVAMLFRNLLKAAEAQL